MVNVILPGLSSSQLGFLIQTTSTTVSIYLTDCFQGSIWLQSFSMPKKCTKVKPRNEVKKRENALGDRVVGRWFYRAKSLKIGNG
jgi:hypothetical protein